MIPGDDDGPWTVTTLKAYFERVICDINRRLSNIDILGRNFYSRDQHDGFAQDINRQFDQMRLDMEIMRRPQWIVWFAAITLLMSITGALWYLAVQPLKEELAHLREQDNAFTETMKERRDYVDNQTKITNDRIDRLYELYRDIQKQHFDIYDGPNKPTPPTKKSP